MPKPRKQQISLSDTPYYHCVSRCVRRAYLCGNDPLTGQSYNHRRAWVENRLLFLAQTFAIDVCAYAVMHNHTHVVLFIDAEKVKSWSDLEVLSRWHKLYKGTSLTRQFERGAFFEPYLLATLQDTIKIYRKRLASISWFMKCLNEPIARKANAEDGCKGRFWEGRFKSQPLLDDIALLACMAYVDLNPVRSKIATTPEVSKHTSIKKRIDYLKQGKQPHNLSKFVGIDNGNKRKGLPFSLNTYIQIVDLTGRCMRPDKPGVISPVEKELFERLQISAANWLAMTSEFEQLFKGAVGAENVLTQYCNNRGFKRRDGIRQSQSIFC